MPWTLDNVVGRMLELEDEILELRLAYEQLKAEYEKDCVGHRNGSNSQKDPRSSDQGH